MEVTIISFTLLGILLGIALSILVLVFVSLKRHTIETFVEKIEENKVFNPPKAYIAGLTEEQQITKDYLDQDKDIKII